MTSFVVEIILITTYFHIHFIFPHLFQPIDPLTMPMLQTPQRSGRTKWFSWRIPAALSRRSCRQTVIALAFLAILTFALKLQHMVLNLNQEQDISFRTGLSWTFAKAAADASRGAFSGGHVKSQSSGGVASPNEDKAFAQLGIKLINVSLYENDNANLSLKLEMLNVAKTGTLERMGKGKKAWNSEGIISRSPNVNNLDMSVSAHIHEADPQTARISEPNSHIKLIDLKKEAHFEKKGDEIRYESVDIPKSSSFSRREEEEETYPDMYLAIVIVSRPNNLLHRLAARKTWARNAKLFGTALRFIVGRDASWDSLVDEEQERHKDLIIVEEEDVYDLLPAKVLEGLTWALQQEPRPQYIMKADDDSMVNLPYLLAELQSRVINSSQILGAICKDAPVVRDPSDKWAVSVLDYPLDTYPTYAAGGGYVMSAEAATALLAARRQTISWFHLEDVYITGILALKAGLSHVAHPGFSYWSDEQAQPCDFILNKRIVSVGHTDIQMNKMFAKTIAMIQAGGVDACLGMQTPSSSVND